MGNEAEAVLRVERGLANEEELAALAAVLLARRAGAQQQEQPWTLGWAWWRQSGGYASPASWR